jgi:hypothetical protein
MRKKVIANSVENEKQIEDIFFDDDSYSVYIDFISAEKQFLKSLTGLLNIETNKLVLQLSCSHKDLAIKKDLYIDEKQIANNWYGFNADYWELNKDVNISPMSGQFGGIPIVNHTAFENNMKILFAKHFSRILYYQLDYERNVERINLMRAHNDDSVLTEIVLENEELMPWLYESTLNDSLIPPNESVKSNSLIRLLKKFF